VQNFWELRFIFVGRSAVVFNFGQGFANGAAHTQQKYPVANYRADVCWNRYRYLTTRKLSGGHVNPAVSLAFWLQGKMHQTFAATLLTQFRRNYWCWFCKN